MGLFERMMGFADRLLGESNADVPGASESEEISAAVGAGKHAPAQTGGAGEISPCERELSRTLAQAATHGTASVRYALLFSGDVQGVGFRWTNQGLANEHGLTGWARNLDDGTVEMELQGSPAAASEHLARIHAYYRRFHNRIWLEHAEELPLSPGESTFSVRY